MPDDPLSPSASPSHFPPDKETAKKTPFISKVPKTMGLIRPMRRRIARWFGRMAMWLGGTEDLPAGVATTGFYGAVFGSASALANEHDLLRNISSLRQKTANDVMVPRADVIAIGADASLDETVMRMTQSGHSRLPVYTENLDDTKGIVHIKDLIAWRGQGGQFVVTSLARPLLFVAPSIRVLDLLLEMRVKRCHMALVVDEYGGVDGLVTIEDLVEEIVGDIEDEHDRPRTPDLLQRNVTTIEADARALVEDLESMIGSFVSDEERDNIDTVGGLVCANAGRVPIRGELITHASGLEFHILGADPKRVHRVLVRYDTMTRAADEATAL